MWLNVLCQKLVARRRQRRVCQRTSICSNRCVFYRKARQIRNSSRIPLQLSEVVISVNDSTLKYLICYPSHRLNRICMIMIINIFICLYILIIDAFFAGPSESTNDRVCLRSTVLSTIIGIGCGFLCLMAGTILAMCSRIRRQAREKLLSDSISYMTHKGRIN